MPATKPATAAHGSPGCFMTATSHWQSRHILSDWASVMSHQRQSASCRSVPPARRLGRCSPLYETPRRLRPRSTEDLRQWMKLRLQREESVDCGETIEMIPGGRDYVSQMRRSHECVDVFLRLPLLDGDKCAGRGIGGEQIVGNATVVAPAWADERSQSTFYDRLRSWLSWITATTSRLDIRHPISEDLFVVWNHFSKCGPPRVGCHTSAESVPKRPANSGFWGRPWILRRRCVGWV